jgi:hypothetical protein
MQELRQSTQIKVRIGPAVDATDGVTPETGLALGAADQAELLKHNGAATVDISGATFAAVTGCDGWYDLTLTTSHTDTLGLLDVVIQDSSLMVPVHRSFVVVTANYWDSKYGSDVRQADVTQLAGAVQSLTDLKDFADSGYDPATNKVEGVKLVDTTTINTDMVGTDNAALASALSSHDGKLDTAQTDLDTLTGADGATLATSQGNYAPSKAGDQMNLVADQSAVTVGTVTDVTNDVGITQSAADKVFGTSGAVITEPSAGAPPATPKPREVFGWLWAHFRNKGTLNKTTGEAKIYNDAETVIAKGTDSDDGTTFTKGELGAP